MTTIRYFVPEDGDSELYPNVFLAPKPRQQGMPPTLGEIKGAFPLPGRYHFRFKAPLIPGGDREKNGVAVWMDCVDENKPIPVWQNSIIAKVTRIGVEDDDDDDDDDFGGRDRAPAPTSSEPIRATPAAPQPAAEQPMLDIFNATGPSVSQSAPGSNSLFDLPAPAPAPPVTLLDMNTPPAVYHHHPHQAPSSADHDFFGMTGTTPQTPQPQAFHQQTPAAPLSGNNNNNAFNSFSQQQGPFGGLGTPWNT